MRHALLLATLFLCTPLTLHAAKSKKSATPTPTPAAVPRLTQPTPHPTPASSQKAKSASPQATPVPAAKPSATPKKPSLPRPSTPTPKPVPTQKKPGSSPTAPARATPIPATPPPAATASSKSTRSTPSANSSMVLLIGDSLSVGPFGTTLQDLLIARLGPKEVALYASCGSSPEHWLASEPVYETRCGYREKTPRTQKLIDFVNGRRPPPVATPKLEKLLKLHDPRYVLIQLGTNWMDEFQKRVSAEKKAQKSAILDRFASTLRGRIVIWILPPDSSYYSSSAQNTVRELIHRCVVQNGFAEIDSKKMTRYRRGKTGSDGIHYNGEDARNWALGVMSLLTGKSSR